jgi:RimJ/RimL family protein N-acetyltransferase
MTAQHSPPFGADSGAERFNAFTDPRPNDRMWPRLAWPPSAGVVLSGNVVTLVPLVPELHAGELFASLNDDAVWAHLAGRPANADEYHDNFEKTIAAGTHPWAVTLTHPRAGYAAGAVIGTTSFLDISVHDARLEIGSTAYARPFWSSAVNPESKLLLLEYAFDVLGAGRVQLKTDVRNERSQRAIERLGATHEGILRRYQRRADGSVRDTVMFSITAEDWPRVSVALRTRVASTD